MTATARIWLGIDVGTSSVKAVFVDDQGVVRRMGSAPLTLDSPRPLHAEQDPATWWSATCAAVAEARAGLEGGVHIAGIGLTGQKHAFLPLDAQGQPLRPAILWADGRATDACDHMRSVFPSAGRRMGFQALPGLFLPKWIWYREHEPALADRTARLCYAKDWVRHALTGTWGTDRTEASASHIFDFRRNDWSPTLAGFFDLPPDLLPAVAPSDGAIGQVHAEAARALGLEAGVPVVAGAGDNEASALACGGVASSNLVITLGTSGTAVGWSRLRGPAGGLVWNRHVTASGYAATGTVLSAGRALRWALRAFFPEGTTVQAALAEAEATDPSRAPLVFLPSLVGERSPVADPEASGAFVGLRPRHRRGHLMRAVLEGVAIALGEVGVLLRGAGLQVEELRLTAGGAASPFWRALIAAASNLPVRRIGHDEGGAVGAALLAAAGVQRTDPAALATSWEQPSTLESPDAGTAERLAALTVSTRAARNALRGVHFR